MEYKLLIHDSTGKKMYEPVTEEGITWTTDIKGTPSELNFKIKSSDIVTKVGSAVNFKVDGKPVFFGFIFNKKFDKERWSDITAYDQLRYLKNKDTYLFKNKRADQIVRMLAGDFRLKTGNIENTKYVIPKRLEENKSLFDMIQGALDLTLQHTKKMYVLWDNFGKLTLSNIENRKIKIIIEESNIENFSYENSIDKDSYNKVKLTYDNKETGKREVFIAQDSKNMNRWGILQHYEKLQDKENAKSKANSLLNLYNHRQKSLTVKNVLGDTRVRAGTMVVVQLNLGDLKLNNWMLVTKAKHTFKNEEHKMDLTLRGGEFSG